MRLKITAMCNDLIGVGNKLKPVPLDEQFPALNGFSFDGETIDILGLVDLGLLVERIGYDIIFTSNGLIINNERECRCLPVVTGCPPTHKQTYPVPNCPAHGIIDKHDQFLSDIKFGEERDRIDFQTLINKSEDAFAHEIILDAYSGGIDLTYDITLVQVTEEERDMIDWGKEIDDVLSEFRSPEQCHFKEDELLWKFVRVIADDESSAYCDAAKQIRDRLLDHPDLIRWYA